MKSSTEHCSINRPRPITTRSCGHQRHLRQQVAADEHGRALLGEVDEDVADPADALRVEPVGRLVEDHRVRIAEHHAGEAEPLAHAERVALDPALGDVGQPDELQHLLDAPARDPVRRGEPAQVVARRPAGVHVAGVEQAADLVQRLGAARRTAGRRTSPSPARTGRARACSASSCSCRTRSGPRNPVTRPGHDVEAEVVDGDDLAEPLGQPSHLDHGGVSDHARTPRNNRPQPNCLLR